MTAKAEEFAFSKPPERLLRTISGHRYTGVI